jgi:hypothetical protein
MKSNQIPRIAFTITIVETNQQTSGIADNVIDLLGDIQNNMMLAEIVFGEQLMMQLPVIDPITDQLSLNVTYKTSNRPYMNVVANRINQVH